MPSFKVQEKLRREAAILTTAKTLFAEKGFERVTLEEVSEKVGIAKGTIYLHFTSKDELLLAILAKEQDQLLAMLDKCQRADPLETLNLSLETIFKLWDEDLDFLIILETEIFVKGNLPRPNPIFTRLEGIVQEAQAVGAICPTLNPSLVAFTIIKPIPFRFARCLLAQDDFNLDSLKANLRQIILQGIGNPNQVQRM